MKSIQYSEKLHERNNDLPFLLERMKVEKFEKIIGNFHDKKRYDIHMTLKQALNHELVLKKLNRVIKFNQETSYIDINTELIKNEENNFEKVFFKLMNGKSKKIWEM